MIGPSLTLKEGSKVKFDSTKRFAGHNFLQSDYTFLTSRTNNKEVIGTFKIVDPSLTLKEGSKVKSDIIRRFAGYVFL